MKQKREAATTLVLLLLLLVVSFGHLVWGGQPLPQLLQRNLFTLLGGRFTPPAVGTLSDPLVATLSQENQRLHQQLSLRARLPDTAQIALVVRREPETWWSAMEVEFGEAPPPGKETAVVLSAQGLIGSLDASTVILRKQVGGGSAARGTVVLLSSPETQLSVVVGPSEAPFLLQGRGGNQFSLKPVTSGADKTISPGDSVVTSGLGQLYSKGLQVATVSRDGKGAVFSSCAATPSEVVLWWR